MKALWAVLFFPLIVSAAAGPSSKESGAVENTLSVPKLLILTPELSVFAPFAFGLRTPGYDIGYADGFTGMPCLQLALSAPIGNVGPFEVSGEGKLGYGSRSNLFQVTPQGGTRSEDTLRLHWVPVSAATRWSYRLSGFPYVRPTVTVGGGTILIGQQGSLSGINRTFLVPFAVVSPALTFVEGSRTVDWFGGFVFGTSFYSSLSSDHTVRGMSFDLSLNVVL